MSLQRISTTELGKLFNSSSRPVYLMDDRLRIAFVKRAGLDWLGAAAEGLVGCRCVYRSSTMGSGPEAIAAGLCPPPQVLHGQQLRASICRTGHRGEVAERIATFIPLGQGEDVWGVLAIVDPSDCLPDQATRPASESSADILHERIWRFRTEAAARYRADRLVGQGAMMRLARRQAELAVAGRANVLLVGPPGSGRQHLAAAIHYAGGSPSHGGSRAGLVPLDCSLLGVDVIEAALLAIAHGPEAAAAGTVLLHHVDELPPEAQLYFFDFFSRRATGWRLMGTAASPLTELARRGKFHADLAALLSPIVIELPSLAERREDLPLLAQLFLEDHNVAGQRQIGGFSALALDRLDAYHWPGNLDELAQVVAEAYQRCAGVEIQESDLPERLHYAAQAVAQPRRVEETIVLDEYLERVERELIRRALARSKGNKARAARLLGITRPRLYRRMVQLGLEQG